MKEFLSDNKDFLIEEIKKKNKEQICLYLLVLANIGLMLKLFDFITLIYIFIIMISILYIIYIKITKIHQTGAINYLPNKIKNIILKRSIFDILMDIWYLPSISEYIKMLMKPIIYKITPEEATKILEDFDPSIRKILLTKGLINIVPKKVQNVLLPASDDTKVLEDEILSGSTSLEPLGNKINNEISTYDKFKSRRKKSEESSCKSLKLFNPVKNEIKALPKPHSNNELKKICHLDELEFPINNKYILNNENNQIRNFSKENEYKLYEIHDGIGEIIRVKTKVIDSTEKLLAEEFMIKKENLETQIVIRSSQDLNNFCWDNINEYYIREAKKHLKNSSQEIKPTFLSILSIRIQEQIFKKIDYNKLSKAFMIFILTFIIQMIISKKVRRWSLSFLQFAIYITTSLGAGGTLYFLLKKNSK